MVKHNGKKQAVSWQHLKYVKYDIKERISEFKNSKHSF